MKVTLIDYTGAGSSDPARYAASRLVFTKQTRLEMQPGLLAEIEGWPWEKLEEELKYMANTIPSSWEFLDYTFLITQVTRAYTHQQVRTRTASFAQQTLRVLNVKGWTYGTGPSIEKDPVKKDCYDRTMAEIDRAYNWLIENGAEIEDARGVLPTNIHTNIVAKFNMRTFVEMVRKRSSPRTQGEYRAVLDGMVEAVREVHPFIDFFINRTFDVAAKELDAEIKRLQQAGLLGPETATKMIKLVDQMRMQS